LNEEESQPFLRQALDLGINFFDTANVYSSGKSEEVLGRFLKANTRREAVVIATKLQGVMRDEPNGRGLSRKAILFEIDQSLRRLQTDYVDLYQIHRWDYETPIEETLRAQANPVDVRYLFYYSYDSVGKSDMCDATGFNTIRGIKGQCYSGVIDPENGDLLKDVAGALTPEPEREQRPVR
jgi:hypothetical protein